MLAGKIRQMTQKLYHHHNKSVQFFQLENGIRIVVIFSRGDKNSKGKSQIEIVEMTSFLSIAF